MQCPHYKQNKCKTTVALTFDYGTVIERKRRCSICGTYFITVEKPLAMTEYITQLSLFKSIEDE